MSPLVRGARVPRRRLARERWHVGQHSSIDATASQLTVHAVERPLLEDLRAGRDPEAAWSAYAEANRALLDHYAETWSLPARPSGWAQAVAAFADVLARRARHLDLERALADVVGLVGPRRPFHSDVYTLVGWGHVTAWVDDRPRHVEPAAYFCLDRLSDTAQTISIVVRHELAHLCHLAARPPADWEPWSVTEAIQLEAVAIAVTQALVPDAPFSDHADVRPATIAAYHERRSVVHEQLAGLLERVDPAAFMQVFTRDQDLAGVTQSGYLVAEALARDWQRRGMTIAEAARMSQRGVHGEVRRAVLDTAA